MTIAVGDRIPEATLFELTADGPAPVTTADVFAGRRVVLIGVPGAFTPTCHLKHLPGYVAKADEFRARGVDDVVCLTVNDAFVCGAWAEATGAKAAGVRVLGDPAAELARALGLEIDLTARGLGVRCRRFAALVEDGVVRALEVEENPGEVSNTGAEKLLAAL